MLYYALFYIILRSLLCPAYNEQFTYLLLKEIVANERLISVWCKLDHSVVNHAIDEWRRRLSASVDAEGGHFEHYL